MQTIWIESQSDERFVRRLVRFLGIGTLTAKILVSRGITHPQEAAEYLFVGLRNPYFWLSPWRQKVRRRVGLKHPVRISKQIRMRLKQPSDLLPPEALPGLTEAVDVVRGWIAAGVPILVYADYDVDGICSATILCRAIRAAGGTVEFYNPDRFKEGYGVHDGVLQRAFAAGYKHIITADVGITAYEAVAKAKERGQEIVILDHHEPPAELPPARVVVDPKIRTRPYPFEGLCASGIAFKFAQLLLGKEKAAPLIEFAALATVADVVPLRSENRALVREGLRRIQVDPFPGIRALRDVAGIGEQDIRSYHIAMMLGPRLNALGRMKTARPGVRLLLAETLAEARPHAERANMLNRLRQDTEQQILEAALEQYANQSEPEARYVAVVAGENWHHGVVGIVASRLVEATGRPAFVLNIEAVEEAPATEGALAAKGKVRWIARGSARSVPGLNLYEALCECSDLLIQFGGHAAAAGLTLDAEKIPLFRQRMGAIVKRILGDEGLVPRIRFDTWIELSDISVETIREMELLEPTGQDNPRPLVGLRGLKVMYAGLIGQDQTTLKLVLAHPENTLHTLDVIAFRYRQPNQPKVVIPEEGSLIDVVGYLDINVWRGTETPQLRLKDWRRHEPEGQQLPHAATVALVERLLQEG